MFVCKERLLKSHYTQVQTTYIKYEKISNFSIQVVLQMVQMLSCSINSYPENNHLKTEQILIL
jgi:hypothetical protein